MSPNQNIIHQFFQSLENRDYKKLQSCYAENAVYNNQVMGLLDIDSTKAMWQLLCTCIPDLKTSYSNIQELDEEYATCLWEEKYTDNGKLILKKNKAYFRIQDGLIIEHTDGFNFYDWCKQNYGLVGYLFGWSTFMQKRIQKKARKGLIDYKNTLN
jgi:hypothetical protein